MSKISSMRIFMVYSRDLAKSIRRSRPNPLKLSGFVEFFALIILVINFSQLKPIFIKIEMKFFFGFFAVVLKKINFFKKIDDNSSIVARILKPIKYSDSS